MTPAAWVARLHADGRRVLCQKCGGLLGRIWVQASERHFLFPNSMAVNERGVWAMTRRARRAAHFAQPAYRRPLPVGRSLSPTDNPFQDIALEPKAYPVTVECPRCRLVQYVESDRIDVVVPGADANPDPFLTLPLSEPFSRIGEPDDD